MQAAMRLFSAAALGASASADPSPAADTCTFVMHNASGCTAGGAYEQSAAADPAACCARCEGNATGCMSWSFHGTTKMCYLSDKPKLAKNSGTEGTTWYVQQAPLPQLDVQGCISNKLRVVIAVAAGTLAARCHRFPAFQWSARSDRKGYPSPRGRPSPTSSRSSSMTWALQMPRSDLTCRVSRTARGRAV